jgi:ATP-dependent RNA helicase DeaD
VAIASAAVKLAHQTDAGDEAERDIPAVVARERSAPRDGGAPKRFSKGAVVGAAGPREQRRERPEPAEDVARLFVGAGREAGIRPGDLVGAITGEAGINSRELGAIQIADRFSLVEVPASRAEEIIAALRATTIRGRKVPVRRDRDAT